MFSRLEIESLTDLIKDTRLYIHPFTYLDVKKRFVKADADFQSLVDRIWSNDTNRLAVGYDIHLARQGRVSWYYNGIDVASEPLFSRVNETLLEKPIFKGKLSTNSDIIFVKPFCRVKSSFYSSYATALQ